MKKPLLMLLILSAFVFSCTDSGGVDIPEPDTDMQDTDDSTDGDSSTGDDTGTDGDTDTTDGDSTTNPLLNDFWFGYYQEDALTNPEDPLPGFLYLKIPESGDFDGQLYFSFSGCTGGVDIGKATGTAVDGTLTGTWEGIVDAKAVGGDYVGELNTEGQYVGTYTNAGGKVEIECDADSSYFVAPNGTWYLQKTGENESLNITIDTDVDPLVCNWNDVAGSAGYVVIFIDADCLEEKINLEECLTWSGAAVSNSIIYGEGLTNNSPPVDLVSGKSYLVSVTSVDAEGEATVTGNTTFTY